MNKEVWKNIQGFDGKYQVSNIGNVREKYNERWKLKHKMKSLGYWVVNLNKNGQSKQYRVHRLVAIAFIPNPHNKPYVHHIDENRGNPRASNLKWVTPRENIMAGTVIERSKKKFQAWLENTTKEERELNMAISAATNYCLSIDQLMIVKNKIDERIKELERLNNG